MYDPSRRKVVLFASHFADCPAVFMPEGWVNLSPSGFTAMDLKSLDLSFLTPHDTVVVNVEDDEFEDMRCVVASLSCRVIQLESKDEPRVWFSNVLRERCDASEVLHVGETCNFAHLVLSIYKRVVWLQRRQHGPPSSATCLFLPPKAAAAIPFSYSLSVAVCNRLGIAGRLRVRHCRRRASFGAARAAPRV